jgi:hypothetical protein
MVAVCRRGNERQRIRYEIKKMDAAVRGRFQRPGGVKTAPGTAQSTMFCTASHARMVSFLILLLTILALFAHYAAKYAGG